MNEDKISVPKNVLLELRRAVMLAIYSEDGLDGGPGERLLIRLNPLLGLETHDISWIHPDPETEPKMSWVFQAVSSE